MVRLDSTISTAIALIAAFDICVRSVQAKKKIDKEETLDKSDKKIESVICKNCGATLSVSKSFCSKCGQQLRQNGQNGVSKS